MERNPAYRSVTARLHADTLWLEPVEPKVYGSSWGEQAWVLVTVSSSSWRVTPQGGLVFVPLAELAEALGWDIRAWAWFADVEVAA
jgi:hypothetical protein